MKKFFLLAPLVSLLSLLFSQTRQGSDADEQLLIKLANDWMNAMKARDAKTLNRLMGPEYKLGGTDFDNLALPETVSRETWLMNAMQNLKVDSVRYLKMKVDIIENTAIIQSKFYWKAAFHDKPFEDSSYLVDVWLKRKEGWQVVNRLVAAINKTKQ